MKTKNLLLTAAVIALGAITFNASATEPLLSPRAAGNQIKIVPSTPDDVTVVGTATSRSLLSPRAAGNVIVHTADTETTVKCHAEGNPKYIAWVGNNARIAGCNLTLAECPVMSSSMSCAQ